MNEMSKPELDRPDLKPVGVRGIDHLAFVTDDMPVTMDFYTRVLKMQLVHVRRVPFERNRGQPPYENLRHYFFNMGNDSFLAFFEYPKGLDKSDRDLPGGMQHVAFHVPKDRFDDLCAHVAVNEDGDGRAWHRSGAIAGRLDAPSLDEVLDDSRVRRTTHSEVDVMWVPGTR